MKNWHSMGNKLIQHDALRLLWLLVTILSLVLGSGAPTAFGGGSGGGG
jgi:hypothetical protein